MTYRVATRRRPHRRGPDLRSPIGCAARRRCRGASSAESDDARDAGGASATGCFRRSAGPSASTRDRTPRFRHHVAARDDRPPSDASRSAGSPSAASTSGSARSRSLALAWRVVYVIARAATASCSTATRPTTTGRPTSSPRATGSSTRRSTAVRARTRRAPATRPRTCSTSPAVSKFIGTSETHAPARVDAARRGRGVHDRRARAAHLRAATGPGWIAARARRRRTRTSGSTTRCSCRRACTCSRPRSRCGPRTGSGTRPRCARPRSWARTIALAALSRAEALTLFPFLAIPFAFLVTRERGRGRIG